MVGSFETFCKCYYIKLRVKPKGKKNMHVACFKNLFIETLSDTFVYVETEGSLK